MKLTTEELHVLLLGSSQYLVTDAELMLWYSAREKLKQEIALRTP